MSDIPKLKEIFRLPGPSQTSEKHSYLPPSFNSTTGKPGYSAATQPNITHAKRLADARPKFFLLNGRGGCSVYP